jgi:hypothetical protein
MPPVVVSRNAIDEATAPPKASPRRPGRRRKAEPAEYRGAGIGAKAEDAEDSMKQPDDRPPASLFNPSSSGLPSEAAPVKERKPANSLISRPLTPVSMSTPDTPAEHELRNTALWQYLMIYLPHSTPLPEGPYVCELLFLPRQRDLPHRWKFQLAGGHPTTKTLCAVLVYIAGVKQRAPCDICAGSGDKAVLQANGPAAILPFPECITLPDAASAVLKQYFGDTACCNRFYQSRDGGKGDYCVSRFSVSSSELGGTWSAVESGVEKAAASKSTDTDEDEDNDSEADSSDSGTSIAFSPSTARNSPGFKTALPARVAGRPKMVSIGRASKTSPVSIKTKRQSSIRRLAAKLGAKAARREVAVYKPQSVVAEEGQEAENHNTTTEASNGGTRRSRRLLEQQREQQRPESKQSVLSRLSEVGASPSKSSKLRKRGTKESSAGSDIDPEVARRVYGNKRGAVPSFMMADWEIAPGRIRVGSGHDAESEDYPFLYFVPEPPYAVSN